MRVISVKTIKEFWKNRKHRDSEQALKSWYQEAKRADWHSPADIKTRYRSASILKNNRAVFNIKGNQYRLIVAVNYKLGIIFVRFVGTHEEYDKINAQTI